MKAWSDACNSNGKVTLLIPKGTYLVKQVIFSGPCKGLTNFKIQGTLKAPIDPFFATDKWINFQYVNNLVVGGPGTLDGQGSSSWSVNDCKNNPNCPRLPIVSSSLKSYSIDRSIDFNISVYVFTVSC